MLTTVAEKTYERLLEGLPLDPRKLLDFKLPRRLHKRMSELLALNQEGRLDRAGQEELERFLAAEVCVRILKAEALAQSKVKKTKA